MGKFSSLTNLRVLKLRGIAGLTLPAFSLSGGLSDLKTLKNLQKLVCLTTTVCFVRYQFHEILLL